MRCGPPALAPHPPGIYFADHWVQWGNELGVPPVRYNYDALGTSQVGCGQALCPGPGMWLPVARGAAFRSPVKSSSAPVECPFSGLSFPICTMEGGVECQAVGAASLSVSPPAELMERAAVPPLWPALYPPGRSSLHHAQQLQLFSQQHFLRQQEFLYLQQQAAQALELQRSAQLVVSGVGQSQGIGEGVQ